MMSPKGAFLLCAVLCLCATTAFAGGFQLNEHGARALAQGGAFAARAYDGSALYFNPAGFGFQTKGQFHAGATLISPVGSFYGPYNYNSNQKWDNSEKVFTPINVYLSQPVTDRLHVALGVNNPFGLGTQWPDNWAGKYLTTQVDLQSFFFSPTVAYKLTDNLSIGAGFNYVTGTVKLQRAVAVGFGEDPRVSLDLSGHGFGWTAGLLYKFTPELSAGISYRSSVKMDASGSAAFTPAYSVLPAGDASATITLPATGFAGVAYRITPEIEVEADAQYIGWSSYDELAINFKANNSTSVSPKKYKDTYILRFGGEYALNESLRLRAGYLFDHSPVRTSYVEPMLPDANRHGLSAGVGYSITQNLSVDAAYLWLRFLDRKVENTIPEIHFDGTYRTTVHLIGVDFTYTF